MLGLKVLCRPAAQVARRTALARRNMGTSPPAKELYMFGEKPGPRKWESWEALYYIGMGGAAIVTTVGLIYKPETSIKAWARDEAEVRNQLMEDGKEVEMGVNYSQKIHGNVWFKTMIGAKPVRGGDLEEDEE